MNWYIYDCYIIVLYNKFIAISAFLLCWYNKLYYYCVIFVQAIFVLLDRRITTYYAFVAEEELTFYLWLHVTHNCRRRVNATSFGHRFFASLSRSPQLTGVAGSRPTRQPPASQPPRRRTTKEDISFTSEKTLQLLIYYVYLAIACSVQLALLCVTT